jgi:hypothetical protein
MGQCPSGFAPHLTGSCVRKCPNHKRFYLLTENNQPRCTYRPDPTKFVNLTPVGIIPSRGFDKPAMTLDELKTLDPELHSTIINEKERVDAEIAVHINAIDKAAQLAASFKALQDAENVRDQAPEAYQAARVAYYTLSKGPEWIEGEKDRIAKVEADPEIQRYVTTYKDAMDRKNAQSQTRDIMQSVREGVLSLKDDVQYTTKTFQDQIATLKNQINLERRGREQPEGEDSPFFKWVDMILNVLIIVGLLFAGLTIWRKMTPRPAPMAYAPVAPSL